MKFGIIILNKSKNKKSDFDYNDIYIDSKKTFL